MTSEAAQPVTILAIGSALLALCAVVYAAYLARRLGHCIENWREKARSAETKLGALESRFAEAAQRAADQEANAEGWRRRAEEAANERTSLQTELRGLAERRDELQAALERSSRDLEAAIAKASAERADLGQRLARIEAERDKERKHAEEKLTLVTEGREKMSQEFRLLADQVMRQHGEDFKKSAAEQLGGIVAPLKDNIGKFEGELRTARTEALKERAALKEQLGTLTQRSEAMSREAESLTRALRGDTRQQGAWGEAILERLLETSGLENGREYHTQVASRTEEGRALRPDVVVSLPGERELVIDSKVSLTAYDQAVNAEDDAARAEALLRHVRSMQSHIKALAEKSYAAVTSGSLDYVIMFVPIEAALSEAVRAEDGLTQFALDRHVMIATPTTLMMALRTIKTVWDVERRNRNAERIAERAGRIYDKVVGFAGDMDKVGKQLDSARDAHAQALNKLTQGRGNVLNQIETLKKLGAKTVKSLPDSLGIESDDD